MCDTSWHVLTLDTVSYEMLVKLTRLVRLLVLAGVCVASWEWARDRSAGWALFHHQLGKGTLEPSTILPTPFYHSPRLFGRGARATQGDDATKHRTPPLRYNMLERQQIMCSQKTIAHKAETKRRWQRVECMWWLDGTGRSGAYVLYEVTCIPGDMHTSVHVHTHTYIRGDRWRGTLWTPPCLHRLLTTPPFEYGDHKPIGIEPWGLEHYVELLIEPWAPCGAAVPVHSSLLYIIHRHRPCTQCEMLKAHFRHISRVRCIRSLKHNILH